MIVKRFLWITSSGSEGATTEASGNLYMGIRPCTKYTTHPYYILYMLVVIPDSPITSLAFSHLLLVLVGVNRRYGKSKPFLLMSPRGGGVNRRFNIIMVLAQ